MKKKEIDAIKRNKGHMLSGAAVLAIGSVLAKVLGALYRVPLTNILGAEGMGMYQLVFPAPRARPPRNILCPLLSCLLRSVLCLRY